MLLPIHLASGSISKMAQSSEIFIKSKIALELSIPAILGSVVITLIKDFENISIGANAGVIFAGVAAAFVSGFLAIKLLEYISKKNTFKPFAYYCMALGVVAIITDIVKTSVIGG